MLVKVITKTVVEICLPFSLSLIQFSFRSSAVDQLNNYEYQGSVLKVSRTFRILIRRRMYSYVPIHV